MNYSKPFNILLSELRLQVGLSQKELASATGLTPALISKYESGKSKPRIETIERLSNTLNVDKSILLEALNDYSQIILIDYVVDRTGSILDAKPYGINSAVIKEIKAHPQDLGAFLINSDSMYPTLNDGDTVLFNRNDIKKVDGEIYLIGYKGILLVKRVHKLMNGDLRITSDNRSYPENILTKSDLDSLDFEIIGRIVWRGGKI